MAVPKMLCTWVVGCNTSQYKKGARKPAWVTSTQVAGLRKRQSTAPVPGEKKASAGTSALTSPVFS